MEKEVWVMNTRFYYMYRDAANYKDHFEFIFEGELSDAQIQNFVDACNDEYFIPRAMGFPGGVIEGEDGYDSDLDHYWCEHDFDDSFTLVDIDPDEIVVCGKRTVVKVAEFYEMFMRCSGKWEEMLKNPVDVLSIRAEKAERAHKSLDANIAEAKERAGTTYPGKNFKEQDFIRD